MANEGRTLVTAWLEDETVRVIEDFARREDRTRAQVVRILIRAGLAQMTAAGAAPTGAESERLRAEDAGGSGQ